MNRLVPSQPNEPLPSTVQPYDEVTLDEVNFAGTKPTFVW
jgi:hypothetical protein